jgi:KAP family P-loop domain
LSVTGDDAGTPSSPIEVGDLLPDRALRQHDRDEFDYEPLADRIADLCCVAETPVNIALFSPWGSGKSSLFTLIDRRFAERPESIKLIHYDAWRYGGDALPRNFIAHAASELQLPLEDPAYSDLHRGLYENQRKVSLSGPRLWAALRNGRWIPLIVIGMVLAMLGLLFDSSSVLLGGLGSTLLLFLAAIIESGKVEVEQSKPSEDEEFSARFSRLVGWATDSRTEPDGARTRWRQSFQTAKGLLAEKGGLYHLRLWWEAELPHARLERRPRFERLVFFIDELDRCSRDDIVKTLKALRTFLDADRCIFIVAADRQVVEEALSEVEQSTPIDVHSPYYSTASAYLDKIFQHQISLPPLRSRSLAKFARHLTVDSKAGIWKELITLNAPDGNSTPELDLILFTLIPSHVRSPRRIKVLLNNYATNVRIARSRLPNIWPARAREIARLTTFQTEFPEFALDLTFEPRLPRFLLEPDDAPDSPEVREALVRWNLDIREEGEKVENPDPFLPVADGEPDSEDDERAAKRRLAEQYRQLRRRRRAELRRYLERTSDVADLRRDLFYLQPAGLDVGLNDPELAELIEVEATDSPLTVIAALEGRGIDELCGAARMLASMVGDVLGPEQRQVMSALMETVTLLGDSGHRVAFDVAGALRTYWSGNGSLDEDHLVGALRAALTVRSSKPDLVPRLIRDERLWDSAARTSAVVAMLHELDDHEVEVLRVALARHISESPRMLLRAVGQLPPEQKLRVMDDEPVFTAMGEALDHADMEAEG